MPGPEPDDNSQVDDTMPPDDMVPEPEPIDLPQPEPPDLENFPGTYDPLPVDPDTESSGRGVRVPDIWAGWRARERVQRARARARWRRRARRARARAACGFPGPDARGLGQFDFDVPANFPDIYSGGADVYLTMPGPGGDYDWTPLQWDSARLGPGWISSYESDFPLTDPIAPIAVDVTPGTDLEDFPRTYDGPGAGPGGGGGGRIWDPETGRPIAAQPGEPYPSREFRPVQQASYPPTGRGDWWGTSSSWAHATGEAARALAPVARALAPVAVAGAGIWGARQIAQIQADAEARRARALDKTYAQQQRALAQAISRPRPTGPGPSMPSTTNLLLLGALGVGGFLVIRQMGKKKRGGAA